MRQRRMRRRRHRLHRSRLSRQVPRLRHAHVLQRGQTRPRKMHWRLRRQHVQSGFDKMRKRFRRIMRDPANAPILPRWRRRLPAVQKRTNVQQLAQNRFVPHSCLWRCMLTVDVLRNLHERSSRHVRRRYGQSHQSRLQKDVWR